MPMELKQSAPVSAAVADAKTVSHRAANAKTQRFSFFFFCKFKLPLMVFVKTRYFEHVACVRCENGCWFAVFVQTEVGRPRHKSKKKAKFFQKPLENTKLEARKRRHSASRPHHVINAWTCDYMRWVGTMTTIAAVWPILAPPLAKRRGLKILKNWKKKKSNNLAAQPESARIANKFIQRGHFARVPMHFWTFPHKLLNFWGGGEFTRYYTQTFTAVIAISALNPNKSASCA